MDDIFEIIDFVQFINEDEDHILRRYIRDHENPMEFFTSMEFYKRYRYVLTLINNLHYNYQSILYIFPKNVSSLNVNHE